MELAAALDFIRPRRNGVLVALKRDGRPQLSNITYTLGDDGVVRISITADRAKYTNLLRDPRASLYVGKEDFWGYVVIDAQPMTPLSTSSSACTGALSASTPIGTSTEQRWSPIAASSFVSTLCTRMAWAPVISAARGAGAAA